MSTVYDTSDSASRAAGLDAATRMLKSGRLVVLPTDTLYGIAADAFDSSAVNSLLRAFWPGGLSLVVQQAPSLAWDLGDTRGTVMLRMPLHPVALDLLREIGPLAVSSANVSGSPPARTVAQAREQFGEAVGVYLDGGESVDPVASTIVDLTGDQPRILREGAVATADIADVLGMGVETLEGKKL